MEIMFHSSIYCAFNVKFHQEKNLNNLSVCVRVCA